MFFTSLVNLPRGIREDAILTHRMVATQTPTDLPISNLDCGKKVAKSRAGQHLGPEVLSDPEPQSLSCIPAEPT